MNRKEGLDYFPMECVTDDKFKLITSEFGLQGFAIVIKLLQKIYGEHGYYCDWNREVGLLFAMENGLGGKLVNRIDEIVSGCMRRGVFSFEQFKKNGILTSEDIQKNFLDATKRRKNVKMREAYLLIKVTHFSENVDIIKENVDILKENVCILKQSRVEESNILSNLSIENPTLQEIKKYASEHNLQKVNVEKFFNYYQKRNWRTMNGVHIDDWKDTLEYWNKMERKDNRREKNTKKNVTNKFNKFEQRNVSSDEIDDLERRLLTK